MFTYKNRLLAISDRMPTQDGKDCTYLSQEALSNVFKADPTA